MSAPEQSKPMATPHQNMENNRSRAIRKGVLIALGIIIGLLLAAVAVLAITVQRFQATNTIARNVTIAGVAVAGLSPTEAHSVLQTQWLPSLPTELELTHPNGSHSVTREELGAAVLVDQAVDQAMQIGRTGGIIGGIRTQLRLRRHPTDVPVSAWADQRQLRATLHAVAEEINCEPVDAEVHVTDDDQVEKAPGKVGVALQVEESLAVLQEALTNPLRRSVALSVVAAPPPISTEALASIEVVLSSYSTPFKPWKRDRTHNLKLAMARVNNTVLQPGEEFSLNETVGPRLSQAGYRNAPIFRENEVVPEIGGGVCQVATTTYNAALLTNLEILERRHHSRIVDYCPSGRDATVYFGQIDLKFKNSLSHPILILGGIEENQLWAKILGKAEDDYDVKLIRTNVSRFGHGTKEIPDPELEAGKRVVETEGHGGGRATLIREVYSKDGELLARQTMHSDVYPAQTRVVRVGTKEPEAEPAEEESTESSPSAAGLTPATE